MLKETNRSSWRAMGMWEDGREFLVVMGNSRNDCRRRLDEALVDYDYDDFERIECLWYEFWREGNAFEDPEWFPDSEIKLRRFKLIRAASRKKKNFDWDTVPRLRCSLESSARMGLGSDNFP